MRKRKAAPGEYDGPSVGSGLGTASGTNGGVTLVQASQRGPTEQATVLKNVALIGGGIILIGLLLHLITE